jgi:predicted transcriptional regulator
MTLPIKIPTQHLKDLESTILNFMWKKKTQIAKTILSIKRTSRKVGPSKPNTY